MEDAYAELAERKGTEAPLEDIPGFLDRRDEVCAQCGQPGGTEWDYEGRKVRLHDNCQDSWIDAQLEQG